MKFYNGLWLLRDGFTEQSPVCAYRVGIDKDALTIIGPTRKVGARKDTLDLSVITVRYSSPMPGVIRVQIYHHKGGQAKFPSFQLNTQNEDNDVAENPVRISEAPDGVTMTSGDLSVCIRSGDEWKVDFIGGGKTLTSSARKAIGLINTPQGKFTREELSLGVGEVVYGLGERFTPFAKNGQRVDIWNADGGTGSEQAYKNVPFYMTNRGYGVFVNQPERVSFEIGSEKVERVGFSVAGETLEYFLIYGPDPKTILERYTALTGRPALPPAWSFGLWLTTSFTTNYDEETVTGFIQGMADRKIPVHVFHFDTFWMQEFKWVDFEWDPEVFPDPAGMLSRLKARGLHICLWINPYIAQQSALFDEGMEHGYLLRRPNGDVWQWDMWQPGMGVLDITNPEARRWFTDHLSRLLDMGVDCFKTDFGERIPTDVVYWDGSDPERMHNYYTYMYNRMVFDLLVEKRGVGEAVVFARSATAGSQQFPVHWGGDNVSTFDSMAESLRGGLSLGMSGFGFWSHDIGGFEKTASPAVYKRWCAFGLLSSHSRLHGNETYRVPWLFDEEAVDVLRFFTNLKCRLMPYLYQAGVYAHKHGVPVMRAMHLEFPDDPGCDYLDRQYMLGDSLLVAPIFFEDGHVDYYLPSVPAGKWTHLLSGMRLEGGRWLHETHDYMSLPLMVRPNTILPFGANDQRPDYTYADGVCFHLFEIQDGAELTAQVPTVKGTAGATVSVSRKGKTLRIKVEGNANDWSAVLRNVFSVQSIEGGTAVDHEQGIRLIPRAGMMNLIVHL